MILGYGQIDQFHYSQHVTTNGFQNEQDKKKVLQSLRPNPLNDPIIRGIAFGAGAASPIFNNHHIQLNLFVSMDFFFGLNRLSWSKNDGIVMLTIGVNTFIGDLNYSD